MIDSLKDHWHWLLYVALFFYIGWNGLKIEITLGNAYFLYEVYALKDRFKSDVSEGINKPPPHGSRPQRTK